MSTLLFVTVQEAERTCGLHFLKTFPSLHRGKQNFCCLYGLCNLTFLPDSEFPLQASLASLFVL